VSFSVLIADDEPLAQDRLRRLVAEVPWLRCVGVETDGVGTLRALDAQKPDLVFLDIEMPGKDGLEVLESARHRPVVVFTTAYDQYAVTAFDLEAADYLLKPFGRQRFLAAVERARQALERGAARSAAGGPPEGWSRLFVRDRGRIVALPAAEVERLEAEGDYVTVHSRGRRYLVRLPLRDFERRLDPRRFRRIHRRHLVNLDQVASFVPGTGRALFVEMKDGTRVRASRKAARGLRGLAVG
jgi:two-component system, LytTR family, response regulator